MEEKVNFYLGFSYSKLRRKSFAKINKDHKEVWQKHTKEKKNIN